MNNPNPNSFFGAFNEITDVIGEEDYRQVEDLCHATDCCARMSHKTFYIIDYYKRNFLYVSNDTSGLGGLPSEQIKALGYDFYFNYVPHDDLTMLLEINQVGFNYYNALPETEREKYVINYNFHIKIDLKCNLINHQITPLKFYEGKTWLALCCASPAVCEQSGNVYFHKQGTLSFTRYSFQDKTWETHDLSPLNETDQHVLLYGMQGLSIRETATKIPLTEIAVKKSRQKIIKQMGAQNFLEAIWKSHATLTLLAKQDCPLWLQYD